MGRKLFNVVLSGTLRSQGAHPFLHESLSNKILPSTLVYFAQGQELRAPRGTRVNTVKPAASYDSCCRSETDQRLRLAATPTILYPYP